MKNFFIALLIIGSLALGGFIISLGMPEGSPEVPQELIFSSSDELSHNWGEINILGGDVTKTFTLTNDQKAPLVLSGAVTSCMCTTAEFTLNDGSKSGVFGMHGGPDWTHTVQPGESFDVKVTFDPLAHGPSATGPIMRTVNVISKPDLERKEVHYTRIDVSGDVLSEADYQAKYGS